MTLPTIPGSPPKRVCQSAWPRSATWPLPERSSSGEKTLPRIGCTPRISKNPDEACPIRSQAGESSPVSVAPRPLTAARPVNDRLCFFQNRKLKGDTRFSGWLRFWSHSQSSIRRSASWNGRGRNKAALTMEKIEVVTPIPSARVRTIAMAKAGRLSRVLMPYRAS